MTGRILLAEDNDNLSQLLAKFLAGRGYTVTTARTGLEVFQKLSAAAVDLLILDLRLPVVSGIEVLQKLRKSPAWASLPVIIISGVYKGDKYVAGARRLGVSTYLEKPFTPQAFLAAVEALLPASAPPNLPSLMSLLIDIYNRTQSGLLTIGNGSPIAFLKGEPLSFLSQGKADFGEFLIKRGKITSEELKTIAGTNEERLYLTQAGFLTYDELVEESRLFLTQTITDSLDLKGNFSFSEHEPKIESPCVPLSMPRLFYNALKRHHKRFDPEQYIISNGDLFPARTPLFFRRANLTTMDEPDIELLEKISGQLPFRDIITLAPDRADAARFFSFLQTLGMIEFKPSPSEEAAPEFPIKHLFNRAIEEAAPLDESTEGFQDLVEELGSTLEIVSDDAIASPLSEDEIGSEQSIQRELSSLRGKNYYEVFGLAQRSYSFDSLKEAYFARTKPYGPDMLMRLSGTTQDMAEEILAIYSEAYNTLSNVIAKERYDEMLNTDTVGLDGKQDDRLHARIQYQSGKVFLEMGEFSNAEKALKDAYTLEPENPGHCTYLAWAIYQNPANKGSRTSIENARNLLAKSLQIEKKAETYAFRGWMLLDEGRDGLAEGEFQKALRLNVNEINARNGLRLITEKREREKKGLFRRIFG